MKKLTVISMLIIVFVVLNACQKSNEFMVIDDDLDIRRGLEEWENRGIERERNPVTITIKNKKYLDEDILIAYKSSDGMYCNTILKHIKKDQYRIYGSGGGNDVINTRIHKTDKGNYLIAYGATYNIKPRFLKLEFDSKDYIFEIYEDYFIDYYMIPDDTKATHETNRWFYDKNGKDITFELECISSDNT